MNKLSYIFLFLLVPSGLQIFSSESLPPVQKELDSTIGLNSLSSDSVLVPTSSNSTMNKAQVARVIAAAGFPRRVVPVLTCLAEYESHFNPRAINENTNHTRDYGLMQINSIWLKKEGCDTNVKSLLNPKKNAKCALKIYQTQGLTAWTTYKVFKHTCLAYQVEGFNSSEEVIVDAKINPAPHEVM